MIANDIYQNIKEYNPIKKREISFFLFDDFIIDML